MKKKQRWKSKEEKEKRRSIPAPAACCLAHELVLSSRERGRTRRQSAQSCHRALCDSRTRTARCRAAEPPGGSGTTSGPDVTAQPPPPPREWKDAAHWLAGERGEHLGAAQRRDAAARRVAGAEPSAGGKRARGTWACRDRAGVAGRQRNRRPAIGWRRLKPIPARAARRRLVCGCRVGV